MTLLQITELNGDRADDHTMYFVFDHKMIFHQRIWLKLSKPIKHLLFYIPYKSCKHSLVNKYTCRLTSLYPLKFRVDYIFFNGNTSI